jgi:hypothetical protein
MPHLVPDSHYSPPLPREGERETGPTGDARPPTSSRGETAEKPAGGGFTLAEPGKGNHLPIKIDQNEY